MAKRSKDTPSSYSYIKQLYLENPQWLDERSNATVLARYRADHGLAEDAVVEKKVLNNMANLKSVMRKANRKAKRDKAKAAGVKPAKPASRLQQLEERIDDCMSFAKSIDATELAEIIKLLHLARNKTVWKLGEP
jgi:hypothetical protein